MLAPPRMLVANEGFFRDLRHQTCRADGQLESWEGATPKNIQKPRYFFRIYLGVRSGSKMFEINTDDMIYNRKTTTYFIRRYYVVIHWLNLFLAQKNTKFPGRGWYVEDGLLWEGRGKIRSRRLGDTSCKDAGWKRGQATFGTVFFWLWDPFFSGFPDLFPSIWPCFM